MAVAVADHPLFRIAPPSMLRILVRVSYIGVLGGELVT